MPLNYSFESDDDQLNSQQAIADPDEAAAPGAAAQPDAPTDAPEDTAGDLPTDANPNPGEVAPGDATDGAIDDLTGDSTEDTGVVKIPDETELAVNKVSDAIELIDEEEAQAAQDGVEPDIEQEQREVILDDAIESAEELNAVVESFKLSVRERGFIDPYAYKIGMRTLAYHRRKFGMEAIKVVALEGRVSPLQADQLSLATESFIDTIKNLWAGVVNVLKSSLDWLLRKAQEMFVRSGRFIDYLKKGTDRIIRLREQETRTASKNGSTPRIGDDSADLEWQRYVQSSAVYLNLQIGDKLPGAKYGQLDIVPYVMQIQERIEFFVEKFNRISSSVFIDKFTAAAETAVGLSDDKTIKLTFDPMVFYMKGVDVSAGSQFKDIVAKPHCELFISPVMPGDRYIVQQMPMSTPANMSQTLVPFHALANWELKNMNIPESPGYTGWLPYLEDSTIVETSRVMVEMLRATQVYERNMSTYKAMEKTLISLSERCAQSDASAVDIADITMVASAIKSFAKMLPNVLTAHVGYCQNLAAAFVQYLDLIYKRELAAVGGLPER